MKKLFIFILLPFVICYRLIIILPAIGFDLIGLRSISDKLIKPLTSYFNLI